MSVQGSELTHDRTHAQGNPGFLKYQDTSTGQLVAEHRTKLGSCDTMAQNAHNAFIHLGHQNGTVTLWSPSVSTAQVKLLAHSAPVSAIAVDPSTMGHRMATAGIDGSVKIWDNRMWKCLNEYGLKKPPKSLDWSQKGMLAVGWGNHVSVRSAVRSGRLPSHQLTSSLHPRAGLQRLVATFRLASNAPASLPHPPLPFDPSPPRPLHPL